MSTPTKLLIIGDNVKDKDVIIQSLLPDVSYIHLGKRDTIADFRNKINGLSLNSIINIGLAFENTSGRAQFVEYTQQELDDDYTLKQNMINMGYTTTPRNVNTKFSYMDILNERYGNNINTNIDLPIIGDTDIIPLFLTSEKFYSDGFLTVLDEIRQVATQLNTIDILSCQIQYNTQFDDLYNTKGITTRYSSSLIGINYGWELNKERQTDLLNNVNLIGTYFTDNINNYLYTLGAVAPLPDGLGNYLINNADNLLWLMTYTSNSGAAPNLSSTFKVTADIDMAIQTAPVGLTQSIGKSLGGGRFIGQLLGQNFNITIRGINFTNPMVAPNTGFMGFFGHFGNNGGLQTLGLAQDLNIIYTTNTFTYTSSSTPFLSGLLCGIARSGTINNCRVSFDNNNPVTINYNSTTAGAGVNDIGGLIGRRQQTTIINNCSLNIQGDFNINVNSANTANVGGICGVSLAAGGTTPGTPQIGIFNTTCEIGGDLTINAAINNTGSTVGNIFVGGYVGEIINATGDPLDILYTSYSSLLCNNLSIIDTIIQSPANSTNIRFIGGFCGLYQDTCRINNCNLNTQDFTINIQQHTTKYIGGFCGIAQSQGNGFISSIINSELNLQNLIIQSNNIDNNYLNLIGGFIGQINNLNLRIQLCDINILSSLNVTISAPVVTGSTVSIGGTFGNNEVDSETINLITNIGSLIINANNVNPLNELAIGGFSGIVSSSYFLEDCTSTIGTLTVRNTSNDNFVEYGSMYGRVLGSADVRNNTITINNLSVILSSVEAYIGGMAGIVDNFANLEYCTVTIGQNALIQSLSANNFTALGGLIGQLISAGFITNNNITYGNFLTFKANNSSSQVYLNSIIGFATVPINNTNTVTFVSYPLLFDSILNGGGVNVQGTNYLIQPSSIVSITVNNVYNIDLSEAITLFIYLINPIINITPPCCVANVCDANPVTANYDNRNVVTNMSGQTLVAAVSNFYAAAATGQIRPNAPPIFKTYQQMMDWKQRQNRR